MAQPSQNKTNQTIIPLINNGCLKINYIHDATKPCYSIQHITTNNEKGECSVTFDDSDEELQKTLNDMIKKYNRKDLKS